ncbi:MAG: 50S ribosomal protein L4 [Thermomicrobiales bacterium]|nr:50S ribosomal protein L4 [Thermomicrobiales bacterium]
MGIEIDILNTAGEVTGRQALDDSVWGIEPNISVMHQALLRQQANARLGTHQTKTRANVRGGGRKPWRQKGTGRARQGSIRAPHWVGGGVVFGPHPRSYTQAMPKQMRRLAIRSVLSAKVRDERVSVVDGLTGIEPKTRTMKALIAKLPESRSVLIVVAEKSEVVDRAAGNLPNVHTIVADVVNVRDVLKYERLLVTPEAIAKIEELWALPEAKRTPSAFKQARLAAANAEVEA